jgi:hypothetical protein
MLSHVGDGATESCWWCRYWGDLAAMRCRCWVMAATVLPSQAGDGAIVATWPWCNIDVESCWQWRCWGGLAATWYSCWVILTMVLPSPVGDGAAGVTWLRCDLDAESCYDGAAESCWQQRSWVTWPWRDVDAESCWRRCCRADVGCGTILLLWCDVVAESCCAIEVGIYDRIHDVRPESGCTCIISMHNG